LRIAVYENLPLGGALRTSYELGRALLRRGHHIDVFRLSTYPDKGPFDLAKEVDPVHVEPFRPLFGALDSRVLGGHFAPRSYTLFSPLKKAHQNIAKQIRDGGYDAVLLHPDAMTGAPYLLGWLDGMPTVYYCQEPPRIVTEQTTLDQHRRKLAGGPAGPIRVLEDTLILGRLAAADRENARHARVIAVNSVYSRERVWAAYARNAIVCHLGIEADLFVPAPAGGRKRREVLSFGAPMEAKGHDLTIRAIGLMPPASRLELRIVLPQAASSGQLEMVAGRHGVEVTVERGLPETEVVERYQNALLTACTARLEPFGLTAIESMACGTPVVGIREAGYRDSITDGITGILVEPEPESLAAGITRLADDEALAAKMGEAGRTDVIARWTWERTAAQMETILQNAAHAS
jgi:glycosyltransferase involved in cell wall biosynthesis